MKIDTTHYRKVLQIVKMTKEVFPEDAKVLNTAWTRLLLQQFVTREVIEDGLVLAVYQFSFPKMVKE